MISCGDCGAQIWWAATVAGKLMPVDHRSSATGNVVLTGRQGRAKGRTLPEVKVLTAEDRERLGAELEEMPRYTPHAATCRAAREGSASGSSDEVVEGEAPQVVTDVAAALVGDKAAQALAAASASGLATVKAGTQRAAILQDLLDHPEGLSAHELTLEGTELARRRPGISVNNAGARLGELRAQKLVEILEDPAGMPVTRPAAAGVSVVHVLTAAGRDEARRLAR